MEKNTLICIIPIPIQPLEANAREKNISVEKKYDSSL